MRINIKSITTLFFTGLILQAFVFSNIQATPAIMKLSPFYSQNNAGSQTASTNLAFAQTPVRQ